MMAIPVRRAPSVAKTGPVPLGVMSVTFALTLLIPLQYAVLVGVGISVILFVVRQSTRLVTKQIVFHDDGRIEEVEPVDEVAPGQVVVVADNPRVIRQLRVTGVTDVIGADNVYRGTTFLGETVRRAHTDALAWVAARQAPGPDEPNVGA